MRVVVGNKTPQRSVVHVHVHVYTCTHARAVYCMHGWGGGIEYYQGLYIYITFQMDWKRYIITLTKVYNHRYDWKCTLKCLTALLVYCTRCHDIQYGRLVQMYFYEGL